MKKAILITPTYNERGNIERTLKAVLAVADTLKNWKLEVLVVDDTSPDKTYELVRSLQKKDKRIHLLVNPQKSGLGGAYLKGMAEAFGPLKADVVFEFDADLSHDPTRIPDFLAKIDAGYDLVLGSRYIKGGGIPQDWGAHRKFLSVVGNIVIMTILTDFSIRDWTTGYRAITRKTYQSVLPDMKSQRFTGYTFQLGFLHKAQRTGARITEVPFQFVDRTVGKSKLGPEYLINPLIYIFKVRLQEILAHRIFKFAIVGGMGALIQLISLQLWRQVLPFQAAFFAAIETAVISNFILNNVWTFADRQLELKSIPQKFIQFNLASAGSIIIQQAVAIIGQFLIGIRPLFTTPFIPITVDSGMVFAIVGILIGMFWNFFAYTTFIWKKTAAPSHS